MDGDFIFDRATRVEETAGGEWRGEVTPAWNIFGVPNGGYLVALGLAGAARVVPHPDLLSVSAYYPTKTQPGEVLVRAETLRIGKRVSTSVARVEQDGEVRVHLTAMHTDLTLARGPTHVAAGPPAFPPPDECVKAEGPVAPEFVQNFDMRLTPESAGWATSGPSGRAEMSGWVRFVDGRPPDPASMPLFADCLPPSIQPHAARMDADPRADRPRSRAARAGLAAGSVHNALSPERIPRGGRRDLGRDRHAGGPVPPVGSGPHVAAVRCRPRQATTREDAGWASRRSAWVRA